MMKRVAILMLLGLAGYVAAQTCEDTQGPGACECTCECGSGCPEPEPEPPLCTAGVVGPNTLTTFDGNSFTMGTNNKFVVSRYQEVSRDQCKFQVRVDTEDGPDGSPQVGWVGTGFGVHKKSAKKFDRNFRVSLKQGIVEIRGRGYKPTALTADGCYQTTTGEHPWTFCASLDVAGDIVIRGECPTLGCWYQVTYREGADGANDKVWIDTAPFYNGLLDGMCGNKDGNPANDDQFCPRNTGDVSSDCIDGDHQNNG